MVAVISLVVRFVLAGDKRSGSYEGGESEAGTTTSRNGARGDSLASMSLLPLVRGNSGSWWVRSIGSASPVQVAVVAAEGGCRDNLVEANCWTREMVKLRGSKVLGCVHVC